MAQTMTNMQDMLEKALGSKNVYFQPPENIRLKYPCIIYELADKVGSYANNKYYIKRDMYKVTVVDEDPDSEIPDRILHDFPYSRFDTCYRTANLNHFALTIYFKGGKRYE